MNNPFLASLSWKITYFGIWVAVTVAQILLFHYFTLFEIRIIIPDALICNSLLSLCVLLLWYPVRYSRNELSIPLFLLFHFSLLILTFGVWLGLGYLFTNLTLWQVDSYDYFFKEILPVRMFSGVLIYIIFVLTYYLFISYQELKEQRKIIEDLQPNMETAPIEKLSRIYVKKNREIHMILVSQIHYIEANGDYVLIYTPEGKFLKDKTMKYWETHLSEEQFVRIHRSYIINLEQVAKIELYGKETYKVLLKQGSELRASSSGYKLLKQRMN